jgi:hypothetical protein
MTINEGRRCALPGCYVVIEPEPDGRPQRKYCTAAHRAVARQMRREGTHRSATAPPLPLPTPAPPQPTRVPLPAASTRRRDIAIAALRRCRSAAVLGSAGLLVTGGGLMAASSPAGTPSTISATPWNAADPDAQQKWASKAQVTLASLDTQIEQIDQAKQSWTSLPPARQYAPLPTPIRNLDQQRKLLVAQRQALQSEVDTYHNAQQTSQSLADTEDGLSALDNTLEQSSSAPLTPQQAQTYQLLNQQRQEKVEQRDSQRTQLVSLRNNIQKALAAPLPDDDNNTKSITSEVANLVAHPELDKQSRRPDQSNARPTSPEVTAPREPDDPETDDVGNGAPPNPGKARPEVPQGPQVLADGTKPLDGVTQALPKVGLPQAPAVQVPAAPHVGAPGQNNTSILAAPGQPGGLGEALGNAGNTLGNTANSLTQPLNVTPAPSANATQPAPGAPNVYQTPSGSGGLGSALTSPTLPLNLASGPSAPSGDNGWGSHHDTPASTSGGGGGFDHIVRDPISRVADSEPDSSTSGNSHSADHGSWNVPEESSPAPTVSLPSTPAYPSSDSGSNSSSSDDEKARVAGEIAGSMLGGGMGDLVSSAVKAKEAQDAGGGSSTSDSDSGGWGTSSSDGDNSDLRDSILQDYGVSSDSDSNSSDSSLSDGGWSNNDSSSSDRGSSDYSSADVDNIIDHYSGGDSDDKDSGSDDDGWSSMVSSVSQSHGDSDSDSSDSHDESSSDYSSYSSGSSHDDDSYSDSSDSRDDDSYSHDSYSDSDSGDDDSYSSDSSDSGDDDSYSDSDSGDDDSYSDSSDSDSGDDD